WMFCFVGVVWVFWWGLVVWCVVVLGCSWCWGGGWGLGGWLGVCVLLVGWLGWGCLGGLGLLGLCLVGFLWWVVCSGGVAFLLVWRDGVGGLWDFGMQGVQR
ncbi:hypothetical protein RA265_28100, partial [Pseudomonas syringae pv. tagetis]|uniref:hypothetical protein n=1 Tax=Pseudomonas syringae group genomosp. 7 TaxID=251699 RepID=UPI00376F481D